MSAEITNALNKSMFELSEKYNKALAEIESRLQSWVDEGVPVEWLKEHIEIYERHECNDETTITYTIGMRFKDISQEPPK